MIRMGEVVTTALAGHRPQKYIAKNSPLVPSLEGGGPEGGGDLSSVLERYIHMYMYM